MLTAPALQRGHSAREPAWSDPCVGGCVYALFMEKPDDQLLCKLEADMHSIESSLVTTAKSWAAVQGTSARDFLLREARLVVINQAEVTAKVADEVPTLKAEVEQICEDVTETFERWSDSVDLPKAKTLAQDPSQTFRQLTDEAHDAFGDIFIRRGYDPGTRSTNRTRETSNWFFYKPETGTARNPTMTINHRATQEISDLWSSWAETAREIKTTKDRVQRSLAAQLWDAD